MNTPYLRKVIPFLKQEYFHEPIEREIFLEIDNYVTKYSDIPSKEALVIGIDEHKNISDEMYSKIMGYIDSIEPTDVNQDWLVDETEKFCKSKSIYNAVLKSIAIIDGKDKEMTVQALPEILSDALSVSFDKNVGHDYYESSDDRFEFYHRKEEKIPFDLEILNKITKGGLLNKSLMCWLAATGVGKSLVMCHQAASSLTFGKNVLYITLEMSEERIAERIDANLLDVNISDIIHLAKTEFGSKIDKIRKKFQGQLIIKEYPTSTVHVGHFEHLLDELRIKKNFKPDIIYIDYINLCMSKRFKNANNQNSYTIVKSIAEELRGMAVIHNVPIVTATQVNRSGANDPDLDLTNTADSFGLPATTDIMLALITNDNFEEAGQIMVKQLKNRYNDLNYYKKFTLGINRSKMRLHDVKQEEETELVDSGHKELASGSKYSGFVI